MNGINECHSGQYDSPDEAAAEKLSRLMKELIENEQMRYQFELEKIRYQGKPNSNGYANAVNWIDFYSKEIDRLSNEFEMLQHELLGEECPRAEETNEASKADGRKLQPPHLDINQILESIAPID